MAPRNRKAVNGAPSAAQATSDSSITDSVDGESAPAPTLPALAPSQEERDEVKVNNASVTDMKHACDDALKRVSVAPFRFSIIFLLCGILPL